MMKLDRSGGFGFGHAGPYYRIKKVRGDNAPDWLKENSQKHGFLRYAMDEVGLGIHERAPYYRIDYRTFSA